MDLNIPNHLKSLRTKSKKHFPDIIFVEMMISKIFVFEMCERAGGVTNIENHMVGPTQLVLTIVLKKKGNDMVESQSNL